MITNKKLMNKRADTHARTQTQAQANAQAHAPAPAHAHADVDHDAQQKEEAHEAEAAVARFAPIVARTRGLARFFAARDLEPGEELTFDYGDDYWLGREDELRE